jgi:hypothetical protein
MKDMYWNLFIVLAFTSLFISIHIYLLICGLKKQEGASKEDIEQLSKFKFRRVESNEKQTDNIQEPAGGIMTECRADSPIEHVLAEEDAVCYFPIAMLLLCFSSDFISLYFNGKSM